MFAAVHWTQKQNSQFNEQTKTLKQEACAVVLFKTRLFPKRSICVTKNTLIYPENGSIDHSDCILPKRLSYHFLLCYTFSGTYCKCHDCVCKSFLSGQNYFTSIDQYSFNLSRVQWGPSQRWNLTLLNCSLPLQNPCAYVGIVISILILAY